MKIKILRLKKNSLRRAQALCVSSLILLLVASPAGISAQQLPGQPPLPRFRILIDVNQLNDSEIHSQSPHQLAELAVDGVWAITQNNCGLDCQPMCLAREGFSQTNPDVDPNDWHNVFAALNGANWTISEDEAIWGLQTINNNARAAAQNYIYPSPVRESLAYYESFPLLPPGCSVALGQCFPIVSPEEIQNLAQSTLFGDRIIFLSRSYIEETGEADAVRQGLYSSYASGVVLEIIPSDIFPDGDWRNVLAGINYCLTSGKRCYLLLPPNPGCVVPPIYCHCNNHETGPSNYSNDISEVMAYLYGRVPLDNPNLFLVLAAYGRDTLPPPIINATPCPTPGPSGCFPSSPGFLTGDGNTGDENSVLAAVRALQSYRNIYSPQATLGVLDHVITEAVATSFATGWAIDPETFAGSAQPIQVDFYVDGPAGSGTLAGSTIANIPRPEVNVATGFLGNHGFHFAIPSLYLDGKSHDWYAYGINFAGNPSKNSLLAGSPITATLFPAINASLPTDNFSNQVPTSTVIVEPVVTTFIDPSLQYIGFQGDFTHNSSVVSFSNPRGTLEPVTRLPASARR